MAQDRYVKSFHCVTQWSIKDVEWEGLPIRGLVEPAKVNPEAKWVMFHTVEGYSSAVPIEDGLKEDALMAFKLNRKPLSPQQGFPARPLPPRPSPQTPPNSPTRITLMKTHPTLTL